jgi:hypothetical protein
MFEKLAEAMDRRQWVERVIGLVRMEHSGLTGIA